MTSIVAILLLTGFSSQSAECANADHCRQMARDAIAQRQYERAHDLAWLTYQKGPKQDSETLILIARTQSLSGRGDDAFVMLRRLAEAGVPVHDVESGEDFARVRNHPQWEQLRNAFTSSSRAAAGATPASASPASTTTPKSSAKVATTERSRTSPPGASRTLMARSATDITLPDTVRAPVAMAHDAVSARFVLASPNTDALTVLSQTSTNAAAFTSGGWSSSETTTALAIDRTSGDLWVGVRDASTAALHRLQLISGRRLEVLAAPADAVLAAITLSNTTVYVLDSANRKVLRGTRPAKTLDVFASLPRDVSPTSLALGRNALFVAHTTGILRIDLATKAQQAVNSNKNALVAGLHSLAWRNGALMGIRRDGEQLSVVRVRLNSTASRVTAAEVRDRAASTAATLAGDVYYYTTLLDDGGVVLRGETLD